MVLLYLDHTVQAVLPTYYNRRYFQPGKKIVLLSIIFSILLIISQIFSSLNFAKPPKLSLHSFYKVAMFYFYF